MTVPNSNEELECAIAHLEKAAVAANGEGCSMTSMLSIVKIICEIQDIQQMLADEARLKSPPQIPENS